MDHGTVQGIQRAGSLTVAELVMAQAARAPHRLALDDGKRAMTYRELRDRTNRLANHLSGLRIGRGDRIAILSENRTEYLEVALAAAILGAILCTQNWRLAQPELGHCIGLVAPALVIVSTRFESAFRAAAPQSDLPLIVFGADYEGRLGGSDDAPAKSVAQPEDGYLMLYTSGTTGLPKGALISHRAEMARLQISQIDLGLKPGDGFAAWAPMFHMVSLEHALHVLALGGKVFVVDGADIARLTSLIANEEQWWLVLIPGMIEPLIEAVRSQGVVPKGLRLVGALADLIPIALIVETMRLLRAPYLNSFGSTETGMLPACGTQFQPGQQPESTAKQHNSLYQWRLVDADDRDVQPGQPGEIALRGPTLFSGYWNAQATNAHDFRGQWFHMGDMFIERPDGLLDFADRSKYMIKSGGENIYPTEIERILMSDPRVSEAVVVRRRDNHWGEVPVAFVARRESAVSSDELMLFCRERLSSYKLPKEIKFVGSPSDFPRSSSGKVQRHILESWLLEG